MEKNDPDQSYVKLDSFYDNDAQCTAENYHKLLSTCGNFQPLCTVGQSQDEGNVYLEKNIIQLVNFNA